MPVGDSNSDSAHSTDTGSEQNIQIQIDSCRTHYKHAYDLYNKLWDYEDSIIADLGKQDRYATETEVAKRDELIAEARGAFSLRRTAKIELYDEFQSTKSVHPQTQSDIDQLVEEEEAYYQLCLTSLETVHANSFIEAAPTQQAVWAITRYRDMERLVSGLWYDLKLYDRPRKYRGDGEHPEDKAERWFNELMKRKQST